MKWQNLYNSDKLILSGDDVSKILGISTKSAQVYISRNIQKEHLLRIKRDIFILKLKYEKLSEEEYFSIANIIQTPSYISLTTALSYYNITTQQQRNYIESVAVKRNKFLQIGNINYNFSLVKEELFNGFIKKKLFFIAEPEKAFFDSVYLSSLGRYNLDFDAVNFNLLNIDIINNLIKKENTVTENYWNKICKTYKI